VGLNSILSVNQRQMDISFGTGGWFEKNRGRGQNREATTKSRVSGSLACTLNPGYSRKTQQKKIGGGGSETQKKNAIRDPRPFGKDGKSVLLGRGAGVQPER